MNTSNSTRGRRALAQTEDWVLPEGTGLACCAKTCSEPAFLMLLLSGA